MTRTIKATWTGETGTYQITGIYCPAEPEVGLRAGVELTDVVRADGTDCDLSELATAEERDERSLVEAMESALASADAANDDGKQWLASLNRNVNAICVNGVMVGR